MVLNNWVDSLADRLIVDRADTLQQQQRHHRHMVVVDMSAIVVTDKQILVELDRDYYHIQVVVEDKHCHRIQIVEEDKHYRHMAPVVADHRLGQPSLDSRLQMSVPAVDNPARRLDMTAHYHHRIAVEMVLLALDLGCYNSF